ncbi:MAG: dephospho-CoA kinase [Ruminococcaceae bacterium]|nr:dephospho-CoA kinase [Oscillospiraceae bacterium]
MILGITGGTGCGKTTLLKEIQKLGGLVLDCDAIYHELLRTDAAMLRAIENRFPGVVEDGSLNRKKLGAIVFTDEQALLDLNAITHSAVKQEVLRRLEEKPALAAIDAIGLFEGGLAELCDVTVAVTAPTELRVQRLMQRDGISESYARSRIEAQHEERWFRERCDYTLVNDEEIDAFATKCIAFLRHLGIMKENL